MIDDKNKLYFSISQWVEARPSQSIQSGGDGYQILFEDGRKIWVTSELFKRLFKEV